MLQMLRGSRGSASEEGS
ncbi:hypothetical protein LINPERPRIM_LOCUS22436 [Linum perenne]